MPMPVHVKKAVAPMVVADADNAVANSVRYMFAQTIGRNQIKHAAAAIQTRAVIPKDTWQRYTAHVPRNLNCKIAISVPQPDADKGAIK